MKKYNKPTMKVHTCALSDEMLKHGSSHHDNGNHNGWNNPHNPHYGGAKELDADFDNINFKEDE